MDVKLGVVSRAELVRSDSGRVAVPQRAEDAETNALLEVVFGGAVREDISDFLTFNTFETLEAEHH